MIENKELYSIGAVERDTGIGRDTLRVWERRYGYPEPLRNEKGERLYSEQQLRRLQRIRRLIDQGLRPGKLLGLDDAALDKLDTGLQSNSLLTLDDRVSAMLDAIRSADARQIDKLFLEQYEKQGMKRFILDTVAPLLKSVGDLWAAGLIQIYQEHFVSQQLMRFLNAEIINMQKTTKKPLVLLTTLPGEEHTLGLLMMAGLLSSHGISAINLGGEVPMEQIDQAVQQFHADIIGVTFSSAYPYSSIRAHLLELRELIPNDVDIWAGGEGVRRLRKLPAGVTKFTSLEQIPI